MATKLLGVMEFIGIPCIQFYTGKVKMAEHKFDDAIIAFKSISNEDPLFLNAMQDLLSTYCTCGKYIEWHELLSKQYTALSPIQEMNDRIICLVKMDLGEFCDHYDQIQQIENKQVMTLPDSQGEKYCLYSVVNYLMLALVTAGDMINRCSNYIRTSSLI